MAGGVTAARKASLAQTNRRSSSLRKFVGSESEHADLESLRTELTALMDRKLMKLYQGLDDRWKGLDEANLSILQKLTRFQEVLVALNADSQRLQATVQVLAQGLAKTDKRMYDALEPVYIALDEQKSNMATLEGVMVDVARQLKALESRPAPTVVVSRHVSEWSWIFCSYLMRCPVCSGV
jgi:chromosome segregation ATPase